MINLVNLKSINIKVEFPKAWFPFDENIDISFALHSPNAIPGRHSFDYHRQNTNNNKYFSKIEDIGLENYDNCINRGDIENENNTRNYCLDKCLAGSIGSECLAVYNLKNKQPLRKNQLPNTIFLNSEILKNCRKLIASIENSKTCSFICKEDYYQAHYFDTTCAVCV